jgi:phage-related protein
VATFPALKTGVVAQYPSDRQQRFSTQIYRFVDGSEQRFPAYAATLRKWTIRLDLLDEAELEALRAFFEAEGGRAGTFEFTDPFDGHVFASCSFDSDALELVFNGEQRGNAVVAIRENRG